MKIGIDLGGTKIEVIALEDDGEVLLRNRLPTPANDYEATLNTIAELVSQAERSTGRVDRIGVGTPGSVSPSTGLIRNSNSVVLNGRPLDRDLAARLGREVRLENDANCFALSEAVDGAGAGFNLVFGVILGTGVGGGLVIQEKIVTGRNRIAGEWGHNPLPWRNAGDPPAIACYCGKSDCIETHLSGAGLARDYQRLTGNTLASHDIERAATAGDGQAAACIAAYADRLARSLATVINILDPDAIILGGGLSNVSELYVAVPAMLPEYVFSDRSTTPVLRAHHGDSSGVRGAAWL